MRSQAGTMLHLAAEPRNDHSTMPDLAAGHRGLLRSLASGAALGPSTTWVPPSDRHAFILTIGLVVASLLLIR
jgi:hypothetical protein